MMIDGGKVVVVLFAEELRRLMFLRERSWVSSKLFLPQPQDPQTPILAIEKVSEAKFDQIVNLSLPSSRGWEA